MSRAGLLIVSALLLGCWASLSMAADSPAKLVVGEDSIEALLRLPQDLESGRYTVYCEASILRTSDAFRVRCYKLKAPATGSLIRAVSLAASKARYVPAVREGKQIDVYILFMVIIDTTLDEAMILAVPNSGAEHQRFGLLYSAPQPIVDRWQVRTPEVVNADAPRAPVGTGPDKRAHGDPDQALWARTHVDERGKVLDVTLESVTKISPERMQRLEQHAHERRFLPGFHDRQPRAMFYMEPFSLGR